MVFGDCLLLLSLNARSCLHKIYLGELSVQGSPNSVITPPPSHREAAWRARKGYTLAVEYNMHATWKGWGEQYVYTNPWDKGPGQEALSKGGVHLPPGREGSSEAIGEGGICLGEVQLPLLLLSSQPELEGC